MSRMRTPRMEVVRFNEADVIVASAPIESKIKKITIANFYNGTHNNISYTFEGSAGTFQFQDIGHLKLHETVGETPVELSLFDIARIEESDHEGLVYDPTDPYAGYDIFNGSYESGDFGKNWTKMKE